jgi:integrase
MDIWIERKGNALRLRWRHNGERQCLGLGVKDDPLGLAYAKKKMAEIELDLLSGHYDPTLVKYRPAKLGNNHTHLTAVELFEKYAVARKKDKGLSPGSIHRYKAIASLLETHLGKKQAHQVTEQIAKKITDAMTEALAGQTAKSYLFLLRGCWDWAKGKYHVPEENPWADCIDRVKPEPQQPDKPFTLAELQAIISAFASHPTRNHYTDFVIFLTHMGSRFGEVAALRWENLSDDFSSAWIGRSISRGHEKTTKTGKARTIDLTRTVTEMLRERHTRLKSSPGDLVFMSPKGKPMNDHRFRARAWKPILESCGIEYRVLYNARHSAISHSMAKHGNAIALAEQTGHHKNVLLNTYSHATERKCLFVDFGRE